MIACFIFLEASLSIMYVVGYMPLSFNLVCKVIQAVLISIALHDFIGSIRIALSMMVETAWCVHNGFGYFDMLCIGTVLVVIRKFILCRPRCPFAVAGISCKYLFMLAIVNPCHPMR